MDPKDVKNCEGKTFGLGLLLGAFKKSPPEPPKDTPLAEVIPIKIR